MSYEFEFTTHKIRNEDTMEMESLTQALEHFVRRESHDLNALQQHLDYGLECNTKLVESVSSHLIDSDVINEIRTIADCGSTAIYFGKTLRDIKVVIQDDTGLRDHEIFLEYKAPRRILVSNMNLPSTSLQNREYISLGEVIETVRSYVNDLSRYFHELENIDRFCTVMEPVNATFKDGYRKILLDDRTWLHVEVTPEGLARNIHLIGQSPNWYNKLQTGLSMWDHDTDIVDNIMTIFDLTVFPQATVKVFSQNKENEHTDNVLECAICLCGELPEMLSLPQPLCQNTACGVYYHRNCLYQWLVACAGNRPPALGIANGECPRCHQPITCSEKDS